ncbi:protein translocase subunit SecF [Geobacter sp. SVR]|uniref:protein translocase subunit SecF n=1 Tax=Geobacter sp. SVR TaxID=2495594 RepID=UPI00143EF870|nr:protein translocase subunit SecF [Geobacter sp. SVR]BCS53786.1 protein-export membrane protein SecF [Geobacter sp. SVR]GCF85705.1 protein-export membrane protein SecF [Geobacter sp. SVR]
MELLGKTNIDFIGKRKISFIISIIISIIGIIGIIQIARGTANMGIDFAGGTSIQLKFAKPMSIAEARKALHENGIAKADLQEIKEGNKLLIKIDRHAGAAVGKSADVVQEAFKKHSPDNAFTVESSTEIGPSIGDKLRKDTLVAVVISLICIVLYIAWRFDFKFGIGATLATTHDCLAMFAVFYLLDKEINLLFITAVLTIAGYSLTDTVVVFDRIRENLHKNLKGAMEKIFNDSINEVLSRTIVTSLTVLLASASLFFFGGEVIHDFALALLIGLLVGTYSSIFVASPIVVLLENRALAKHGQKA